MAAEREMTATLVYVVPGTAREVMLTDDGFRAKCRDCRWVSGIEHARFRARRAAEAHRCAPDVLTLTATLAGPGAMCSGHRDEIPALTTENGRPYIPAYADGDGWLWCLACAKHMTACDDADCAHPRAVFADAVPA